MEITLTGVLRFLHVLAAFALITGIFGRNLIMGQAARSSDLSDLRTLVAIAARFEDALVKPASLLVLALGIWTALRLGWPILGFLEGGESDWLLAALLLYISVLLLVPLVFVPADKTFDASLQASIAAGSFTPELTAALRNPVVLAAHVYEVLAAVAIIFLMVVKPF